MSVYLQSRGAFGAECGKCKNTDDDSDGRQGGMEMGSPRVGHLSMTTAEPSAALFPDATVPWG